MLTSEEKAALTILRLRATNADLERKCALLEAECFDLRSQEQGARFRALSDACMQRYHVVSEELDAKVAELCGKYSVSERELWGHAQA